jgi:hypothetical protein
VKEIFNLKALYFVVKAGVLKLRLRLPKITNPFDISDFLMVAGIIITGYGLHLIYLPLGYIFIGLASYKAGLLLEPAE